MDTKKCSKCGVEKALCEFYKNKGCKDGHSTICKICSKNYFPAKRSRDYYHKNKERIAERRRLERQKPENKEKARERRRNYVRKRRQSDPSYHVASVVSNAVRKAIKNQGTTKGGSTFSALPYTPSDLVEHLEKQFDETMTWENYGDYWEVDHIYPQSLLPYDSLDHPNFQKCWALDNLQPLEKSENRAKSNKVLDA
jgi:hypothetical protein